MMIQCVPYKEKTNTVKYLFFFISQGYQKVIKMCNYSRSDKVLCLHEEKHSHFRGVLQHSKNLSVSACNSLFLCVMFKVLQASWPFAAGFI